MLQIILTPFSWVLTVLSTFFNSYGLALIVFSLLIKIILFPFQLKGKRSMIQTTALNTKMQKLQKMYGNNKQKYNEEVQKLYEKENVNPMGGCLWSMLPMLLLFPLYAVVREPLTYMMSLGADQITALLQVLAIDKATDINFQLTAAAELTRNFQVVSANPALAEFADKLLALNFNFLGVNLAQTPNWQFWAGGITWNSVGLFLLPVISAGTSLLMSMVSMHTNNLNQQNAATNSTSKTMMLMSPVLSLWIGFTMPASMSIYWISQSIFSVFQEIIAAKLLRKDYERAAIEAARREAEEKEEEKRQKELERQERARRIEEQKHSKGKKKPAKKDAEDDKIPAEVKEASRVGIRAYARGRAYDPARFSADGPTPYHEDVAAGRAPTRDMDEPRELEQAALEGTADEIIVEELREELNLDAAPVEEASTEETPAEETPAESAGFETPTYEAPNYDGEDKKPE